MPWDPALYPIPYIALKIKKYISIPEEYFVIKNS